jgi:hypothetical protein
MDTLWLQPTKLACTANCAMIQAYLAGAFLQSCGSTAPRGCRPLWGR